MQFTIKEASERLGIPPHTILSGMVISPLFVKQEHL